MLGWNMLGSRPAGKHAYRQRSSQVMEAGPDLVRSLRLVHQEVRNLALLIATTTSALNVWRQGGNDYSNEIRAYLPPDALIIGSLSSHLAEQGIHTETMELLQNFRSRMTFTTGLLKWFKPDGAWDTDQLDAEIEYIADAWRSLCALTICVLYEIEGIILVSGDPGYVESETVRHLLTAARDGGYPCIKNGRPIVPGWAERRAYQRFAVDLPAVAMSEHGRSDAVIVDISRGGVGLERAEHLVRGSKINLAIPGGGQLCGTVQWVHGSRAGVKLFDGLSDDQVAQLVAAAPAR
jgi:hypothetical protein